MLKDLVVFGVGLCGGLYTLKIAQDNKNNPMEKILWVGIYTILFGMASTKAVELIDNIWEYILESGIGGFLSERLKEFSVNPVVAGIKVIWEILGMVSLNFRAKLFRITQIIYYKHFQLTLEINIILMELWWLNKRNKDGYIIQLNTINILKTLLINNETKISKKILKIYFVQNMIINFVIIINAQFLRKMICKNLSKMNNIIIMLCILVYTVVISINRKENNTILSICNHKKAKFWNRFLNSILILNLFLFLLCGYGIAVLLGDSPI